GRRFVISGRGRISVLVLPEASDNIAHHDERLAELAQQIDDAHGRVLVAIHAGLVHARIAGGALCEAKELVGHGGWLNWVKLNVHFSERTARNYMTIFRRWVEIEALLNRQPVADLGLREVLKLLAGDRPPAVVRPQVVTPG